MIWLMTKMTMGKGPVFRPRCSWGEGLAPVGTITSFDRKETRAKVSRFGSSGRVGSAPGDTLGHCDVESASEVDGRATFSFAYNLMSRTYGMMKNGENQQARACVGLSIGALRHANKEKGRLTTAQYLVPPGGGRDGVIPPAAISGAISYEKLMHDLCEPTQNPCRCKGDKEKGAKGDGK